MLAIRRSSPLHHAVALLRLLLAVVLREVGRVLVVIIRAYQILISPMLGPVCRFEPSCSRYAVACIEARGPIEGSWLAFRRLLRCHPFHPGGHDPPPLPREHSSQLKEARTLHGEQASAPGERAGGFS